MSTDNQRNDLVITCPVDCRRLERVILNGREIPITGTGCARIVLEVAKRGKSPATPTLTVEYVAAVTP